MKMEFEIFINHFVNQFFLFKKIMRNAFIFYNKNNKFIIIF